MVRFKEDIAGFMRVKDIDSTTVYGASFNINPSIKGSRIGTELLKEVIREYSETKDFTADVYEKNPMLDIYTKDFGFEIVGTTENYHNTGTTVLQIVKRKKE